MSDLEKLFNQSNAVLFKEQPDFIGVKEVLIERLTMAQAVGIVDNNNTQFDNLIRTLEYSLEIADDATILLILGKINNTLVSISDSFESISTIMKRYTK